jgi:hypothetical protein
MAVHDIQMEHINLTFVGGGNLFGKAGKIGAQN